VQHKILYSLDGVHPDGGVDPAEDDHEDADQADVVHLMFVWNNLTHF
jgi:hypothetical protein